MSSQHLITRLIHAKLLQPEPQWGATNVPKLLSDAATEIDRLRKYALKLEALAKSEGGINQARKETQVNWEAIHGVNP